MEDKKNENSSAGMIALCVVVLLWLGLCGMAEGYGFFEGIFQSTKAILKLASIVLGIIVIYFLYEYFVNKK
jgi:hypothetical protein